MKKRLLSLLLAAAMCCGLIVPASAEAGVTTSGDTQYIVDDALEQWNQVDLLSSEMPIQLADPVNQRTINFNADWRFNLGNVAGAYKKSFDDSSWRTLDLPHDWSIEQDFDPDICSEIGHLAGGTGWYRKTFVLPASMAGKHISVDFGGVYMDSYIYLNGTLLGNYPYGYLPFSFDITDLAVCDGVTENVLAVKATNITPERNTAGSSSRWYSGSGIYRDVELTVTDLVHVARYGTQITTPDLETEQGGDVSVKIITDVANDSASAADIVVRSTVLTYEDERPASVPVTSAVTVVGIGQTAAVEQTATVSTPKLWSPDAPNLYKVRTEILQDGKVVDTYDSRFGFRYFHFDKDAGFSLNGTPTRFNGACMHHDQGALGAVANYRAIERQMEIMKEMGVNAIRVTHNPAADELLQICDEMGLMVIDEAFDCWADAKKENDYHRFFNAACTYPGVEEGTTWAKFDIQGMVDRGKNYPSIIMWSLGNEIYDTNNLYSVQTAKDLKAWVKEVDTTRPVTMGEDKLRDGDRADDHPAVLVANEMDVVGLNYTEHRYDYYRERHPDWIIYGSENSSALKSRGYYSAPEYSGKEAPDVVQYQLSSFDNRAVPWGKTASDSWIPDRDRSWIMGEFVWTGFDYIGEPTPWNPAYDNTPKSAYFGNVDTAGFPKDDYYLYQSQWLNASESPMVHIFPHWNWEDDSLRSKVTLSNGKLPMRIYSNAPKVELFVDGVSQGEKSFYMTESGFPQQSEESDRLYLQWDLDWEYKVGTTIKAVAKNAQGKQIAEDTVVTAGAPAQIELSADRAMIQADGDDLSYITVDVQDKNGNFVPTADNQVTFRISGNGKIVGVDNGNAASWERYKDTNGIWQRKAFNGKALVIVQSTRDAGSFTLTATGAGVSADSVTVYTQSTALAPDTVLGYEIPSCITSVGVMPKLPTEILAVLGDGSKVSKAVTWTQPTPEQLAVSGLVTITGTVTDTGDAVILTLTVRGISGVQDTLLAVRQNAAAASLPATAAVLYSDGYLENRPVTWDRAITTEEMKTLGTIEISGTVEGLEKAQYPARLIARVTDQVVTAPVSNTGAAATASYEQGNGGDPVRNIADGSYDGANYRWTSWNSPAGTDQTIWVQIEYPKTHVVSGLNINFYLDGSCHFPKTLVVQGSVDGENWTAVTGQDKTTAEDFGEQLDAGTSRLYTVSFDAVETKYIRMVMTTGNNNPMNNHCLGLVEVVAVEEMLVRNSDATLSDLAVGGHTLTDFNADKLSYTVTVPYGTPAPEVTAVANDPTASLFVTQTLSNNSAASVRVAAESGDSKTYTVQFVEGIPDLKSVSLTAKTTSVTEDDTLPLTVVGTMQDGSAAPNDQAIITYTVTSKENGAQAAVDRTGTLLAYTAGKVEVTAHMTYRGVSCDSAPLEITIAANPVEKNILSFDQPEPVMTEIYRAPLLPDKVRANFSSGLSREMVVTWDAIDADLYGTYGEFTVQGAVEGYTLRPTVRVIVSGPMTAQQFAASTPRGVVPALPKTATVYSSDGTVTPNVPIAWDGASDSDFDQAENTIVTVSGTVTLEGVELDTLINVRVVENELSDSSNCVKHQNGYELPFAIAYFTNDTKESNDRVDYLNDLRYNYPMGGKKDIWSDYKVSPTGEPGWIGAIIGDAGAVVEKYVDKISIGFYDEGGGAGLAIPQDYDIQYYTGGTDFEQPDGTGEYGAENPRGNFQEMLPDHPFNDDSNWQTVEYIGEKPTPVNGTTAMQEVSFKPVKSSVFRVKMTPKPGYSLGVTEFQVFGKEAPSYGDFTLETLAVNGASVLDSLSNGRVDQVLTSGEIPTVIATASNNAAVTVVPAPTANGAAKVVIVPENGDVSAMKTYTVQFSFEDSRKDVVSVLDPEPITAVYGTPAEELPLPEMVTVSLRNTVKAGGNALLFALSDSDPTITQTLPVVWNTAGYDSEKSVPQVFTGELKLSSDIFNPGGLKANIQITVRDVEFSELAELIARAQTLAQRDYTPVSWAVLSDALTAAKAVTEISTPEEISAGYQTLISAIDALVKISDAPLFSRDTDTLTAADDLVASFVLSARAEDASYQVYEQEVGGDALTNPAISVEGNDLTLTFTARPDTEATFYISATEGGKAESTRTAVTVKPYEAPHYNPPSNTTAKTEKNGDGSTTRTVTNKKTGNVVSTTTYPDGTKIVASTPKDGETTIEVTVPKDKETVIVTIPTATEPKPGEVAVVVHEDGTREILKTSIATEDGMRVLLTESCKLEIVDNSRTFTDVANDHWAADAVQFAASRELFTGTGADTFSPAAGMTRGMLMTVLARLDGQDTTAGDTWYSAGMDWAKEREISDGTQPEAEITRESLAVMLYRYAGNPEVDESRRVKDAAPYGEFADVDSVSGWAGDAMLWAVESGILQGSGNNLNPGGTATRAEVAAMLQRFISQ